MWIKRNWLQLTAIALIVVALVDAIAGTAFLPFAYYQLMNWVVVGAALMVAHEASLQQKLFVTWLFMFVAVIFNPIAPFSLRADVWQIADIVVIVLFLISFFVVREPKEAQ